MSESMADAHSATPQPGSDECAVVTTAVPSTSPADEKTDSRCGVNKLASLGRQLRNVSEATERMLRPLSVDVGHRLEATISGLLMQPKGRLPPADNSGVIYLVSCLDCLTNYCGMTDKRLRTREHEHALAVKRKDFSPPQSPDWQDESPHSSSLECPTAPTTAVLAAVTHDNTTHISDTTTDSTSKASDSRGEDQEYSA
nr:unnamed protein product [Spirometra erinaceieuropaei]